LLLQDLVDLSVKKSSRICSNFTKLLVMTPPINMAGHRSKKNMAGYHRAHAPLGRGVAMAGHMYIIFNLKYMYDMIQVIGKIMNLAQTSS